MERVIAIIVIGAALALVGWTLFGPKSPSDSTILKEGQFTLTEYKITPDRVNLQSGRVKVVFNNQGRILHQIEIYDPVERTVIAKIDVLRPSGSITIWVDLVRGRRYEVYDPIWRSKGMEGLILAR